MEPVKLEPKPPQVLPTKPPAQRPRPAPAMPETPAPVPVTETKPWWQSKGIVAALVGILWFVADPIAGLLGVEIGFLKDGFQIPEDFVPLAALMVALWGRLFATKRIGNA